MGNLSSKVSPTSPLLIENEALSASKLLVKYLNGIHDDEAVRLVYGASKKLQDLFPRIRIPMTFGADLVHLQSILEKCSTCEAIPEMDDEKCNLITAYLVRMVQIEKTFVALIWMAVLAPLSKDILLGTEILGIVERGLRIIYHASGGDPVHFGNTSIWLERVYLLKQIFEKLNEYPETVSFCSENLFHRLTGEDYQVETIIFEACSRLMLLMTTARHYEAIKDISTFLIEACGKCTVYDQRNYRIPLFLALGRSLVGLGQVELGVQYLLRFLHAASIDKNSLLLFNLPPHNKLSSYLISLPEINENCEARIALCKGLLPLVPSSKAMKEDDIIIDRDVIDELLVKNLMTKTKYYREAHDYVLEMADVAKRKNLIKDLVFTMLETVGIMGICEMNWGEEEGFVEGLLNSLMDRNSPFSTFQILYQWYVTRGDMRSAARVMYSYTKGPDLVIALQAALTSLQLTHESRRFLEGGVTCKIIQSQLLFAKACELIHVDTMIGKVDLIFKLLTASQVVMVIDLVLDDGENGMDLLIGYLISSHHDSLLNMGSIERLWLEGVMREGYFVGDLGECEMAVLQFALEMITDTCKMEGYFLALHLLAQRRMPDGILLNIPSWLVNKCKELDINRLFSVLGQHGYLPLIAEILSDSTEAIRNNLLSPDTVTFLQKLTRT